MKLPAVRALVTGASGGIGGAVAEQLAAGRAAVLLVGRDVRKLQPLAQRMRTGGADVDVFVADLTQSADRRRLCDFARQWKGGINVLVNAAGINHFGLLEDLSEEQIQVMVELNLLAPMQLCRQLLAHLQHQPQACIVNIGSVLGAIGYPGNAAYSATKFALRGFSEALHRELAAANVRVVHVAPRATVTALNSNAVVAMNEELGSRMDPPAEVARLVLDALHKARPRSVIGWPEKLFVRLNAWWPQVVDRAIARQLPIIQRHARASSTSLHPEDTQEVASALLRNSKPINSREIRT